MLFFKIYLGTDPKHTALLHACGHQQGTKFWSDGSFHIAAKSPAFHHPGQGCQRYHGSQVNGHIRSARIFVVV